MIALHGKNVECTRVVVLYKNYHCNKLPTCPSHTKYCVQWILKIWFALTSPWILFSFIMECLLWWSKVKLTWGNVKLKLIFNQMTFWDFKNWFISDKVMKFFRWQKIPFLLKKRSVILIFMFYFSFFATSSSHFLHIAGKISNKNFQNYAWKIAQQWWTYLTAHG